MKGPAIVPAALVVTPRNVEAVFGFTWDELAALLAEKGVRVGRLKRRPFAFVADVVAALDGARSEPWSEADTRAAIARAVGGPR